MPSSFQSDHLFIYSYLGVQTILPRPLKTLSLCPLFLDRSLSIVLSNKGNIESFKGSFRDECLNMNWFLSLEDARDKAERWRRDCNEFRPHSAASYLTLAEFALNRARTLFDHRFFLVQSGLRFGGQLKARAFYSLSCKTLIIHF